MAWFSKKKTDNDPRFPKKGTNVDPLFVSKLASDYRIGEQVVVTIPMNVLCKTVPVGTRAEVVERSTDPEKYSVTLKLETDPSPEDHVHTGSYSIASIEDGAAEPFLASTVTKTFPLRRNKHGWILPSRVNGELKAVLKNGTTVQGQYLRGTLAEGGSTSKLKIGTRKIEGGDYAADDISELWLIIAEGVA